MADIDPSTAKTVAPLRWVYVWGPGLLVMLADADAGNVVTAAEAGARWGYRLLPPLLLLAPLLYGVQELTARLGIHAKRGYCELARERFGVGWAWLAAAALVVATIASLVTEFAAVAGIGELYGLPRSLTLPLSAAFLLAIAATGSYRQVERIAIFVGLFELAFFAVAWTARPDLTTLARNVIDLPLGDRNFGYMAAALIGATFNPWMIVYQQSACVEKALRASDLAAARFDTAAGALLTQCLTGAVLVAAAATLAAGRPPASLGSVGEIAHSLSPLLGEAVGRLVFSAGVLGASLTAAIVCSLALAWGLGEVAGRGRALERRPFASRWFYTVYAAAVVGAAAAAWRTPDLVWLSIAAQVLNAFLLPAVVGLLIALAATALPAEARPRRAYLCTLAGAAAIVVAAALWGALAGPR